MHRRHRSHARLRCPPDWRRHNCRQRIAIPQSRIAGESHACRTKSDWRWDSESHRRPGEPFDFPGDQRPMRPHRFQNQCVSRRVRTADHQWARICRPLSIAQSLPVAMPETIVARNAVHPQRDSVWQQIRRFVRHRGHMRRCTRRCSQTGVSRQPAGAPAIQGQSSAASPMQSATHGGRGTCLRNRNQ